MNLWPDWCYPVWSPLAARGYINLSSLKLDKIKIQPLSHTSYISSAQQPGVASDAYVLKNFHHQRKLDCPALALV